MIEDVKVLRAYNAMYDKVSNLMKKGFDSELLYDDKYVKTKVESYNGKINTDFQDYDIPNEGVYCVYFSVD